MVFSINIRNKNKDEASICWSTSIYIFSYNVTREIDRKLIMNAFLHFGMLTKST